MFKALKTGLAPFAAALLAVAPLLAASLALAFAVNGKAGFF